MAMMKKTTTTMSGDPMKRAIKKSYRIEDRGALPGGGVSIKAQNKAMGVIQKAEAKVKKNEQKVMNRVAKIEKRGALPGGGVSIKSQNKQLRVYERAVKKGKISR